MQLKHRVVDAGNRVMNLPFTGTFTGLVRGTRWTGTSLSILGFGALTTFAGCGLEPLPLPNGVESTTSTTSTCPATETCAQIKWGQHFAGPGDQWVRTLAVDRSGHVILGGVAGTALTIGSETLDSATRDDLFIAALDSDGEPLWSRVLGTPTFGGSVKVALDSDGNIFVAATLAVGLDPEGGSPGTALLRVAELDTTGAQIWQIDIPTGPESELTAIALDPDRNVVLSGTAIGDVDLGGGPLVGVDPNGNDVFVAKLDPFGEHLWSKRFGGQGGHTADAIVVDQGGNILLSGDFNGDLDFGQGAMTSMIGAQQTAVFIAKLDPSGNGLFSRSFGDPFERNYGLDLAVDPDGNALFTGEFRGTIDFGDGPVTAEGETDAFLAKIDPQGALVWSKHFGGPGSEQGESVASDTAGNILLSGDFYEAVDFGGGTLESVGEWNQFLVKLTAGGEHLWSRRFGDPGGTAGGSQVAVGPVGEPVLFGAFGGAVDLGNGPVPSSDGQDLFVVQLAP